MLRIALVITVGAFGCGVEPDGMEPPPPGGPQITDDPELPPEGHAPLQTWIAAGHYLGWACEAEAHPARPPGAHGSNRICSNAALSAATEDAPYPVGAASVKELYSGGDVIGFAVARKVTGGSTGSAWYWYENFGASIVADSRGAGLCAGCHDDAPRDFVFTQVR